MTIFRRSRFAIFAPALSLCQLLFLANLSFLLVLVSFLLQWVRTIANEKADMVRRTILRFLQRDEAGAAASTVLANEDKRAHSDSGLSLSNDDDDEARREESDIPRDYQPPPPRKTDLPSPSHELAQPLL
jgi:hypothetical protein